jgi:hypothetical protein
VVYQPDNYGFSWLVYVHGKARLEGNGRTLAKRRNAVRGRRQANPKGAPVLSRCRVAVLDKGAAIAFALRLAAKHHRNAESKIIMLKDH